MVFDIFIFYTNFFDLFHKKIFLRVLHFKIKKLFTSVFLRQKLTLIALLGTFAQINCNSCVRYERITQPVDSFARFMIIAGLRLLDITLLRCRQTNPGKVTLNRIPMERSPPRLCASLDTI